jgi:tetratricopeptide (TPR) repeat protein
MNLTRVPKRAGLCLLLCAGILGAQNQTSAASNAPARAEAYYHFAMAHLYEQLAREHRSTEYVNRAIEEYKLAIAADPSSEYLSSQLVDLYAQIGRLNDAVREAEAVLEREPHNVQMRRVLGRIFRGYLADPGQGRLNEELLRRAIEQYEKIIEIDPNDSESHLHLGNLYRVARDSVKAERAFKAALEQDPNSEEALTGLASLYAELGDTSGAIEMLSRASQRNSNSRILFALGTAYEQAGDHEKAAEMLEKAQQQDRNNLEIRRALARNLLLNDQYDKALEQYQVLARNDPQDPQNFLRISQIHRQKRSFEQAHAFLDKASALAPSDTIEIPFNRVMLLEAEGKLPEAVGALQKLLDATVKPSAEYSARDRSNRAFFYEKLGMVERSRENYAAASKAFQAMIDVDAESEPRARVQMVETARAAREYAQALAESEAAHRKFPEDRSIAVVRASALADSGNARQGATILRGFLKDTPEDRDILLPLAQVLERGKMYAEAQEAIEKARGYAETRDQKRVVYFTLGALYERQKKFDEAEQQFREVLKLDPNDAPALNYLGYMLADRNVRLDEAHDLIQKALDLDPENGAYLDSLGWVYYHQGRLDLAEKLLQRALAKAPGDPTVHDHLGDVYMKQGNLRLAQQEWERSLQEWGRASKAEYNPDEVAKIRKKLDAVKIRLAQENSGASRQK